MRRWALAVVAILGTTVAFAVAGTTSPPAAVADRRSGPPKSLRDDFPFAPPATPEAWAARARVVRRQIQVALGLWPMPEATPLNAVVHGQVARNGYTVDRVFFESLPGHFVTGSLYRPAGRAGRLPAVLLPHGHWHDGRFNEASVEDVRKAIVSGAERFEVGGRYPLQAAAVQLARMGVVSFLFDLEGYADSVQIPIGVAHGEPDGRPKDSPAAPGLFFSADAESRLESIMGLQSWNARRALDFLASLPDVDPARLAVSGASGGGTQTFILGALDDRPVTLFPMVMVGTKMQGGCTCENADYLRIGSGNVEIASLWAPRPLGLTTADDWTKTFPETGFPAMQKLWTMLGAKDNVRVFSMPQFPHNYNYVSRAAMYAWMNTQLKLGLPEPVVEDDFKPLTRDEATVWTADHPAPAKDLYTGELFKKSKAYAEVTRHPYYILSARYGLLEPDKTITPYNFTLKTLRQRERLAWAIRVADSIVWHVPAGSALTILAGNDYAASLESILTRKAFTINRPLKGLPIGQQQQKLIALIREVNNGR